MKILPLILVFITLSITYSCNKDDSDNDTVPISADTTLHEDPGDYSWDPESVINIVLTGSSATADGSGVKIVGNSITITKEGNYRLTGDLIGSLTVNADTNSLIRLILDNASIENYEGPGLLIERSGKTLINLKEETTNVLADGATYLGQETEVNAALFSKSDMTIFGLGTLIVKGKYNDGITSKDGLIIKSGTLSVESVDDGIRGKDYLVIMDGNLTIKAGGNGLSADNSSSIYSGFIRIAGGNINITCSGDGISANASVVSTGGWLEVKSGGGSLILPSPDKSSKGIKGILKVELAFNECKLNCSDDGIHSNGLVKITDGDYTISTADDAIHADNEIVVNNGNIEIPGSKEGLESKLITIDDGVLYITSTDDAINATAGTSTEQDDHSLVTFNGGDVVINAITGDALDSNGSIQVNNGTIIILGPDTESEAAIDYNGVFNINGGYLIAAGTGSNMTLPPGVNSTQHSITVYFSTFKEASSLFHISDKDGNNVVTFRPLRNYRSVIFSSSKLKEQNVYKIYTGGSSSGIFKDGILIDGTYNPGTEVKEFMINNIVTIININ